MLGKVRVFPRKTWVLNPASYDNIMHACYDQLQMIIYWKAVVYPFTAKNTPIGHDNVQETLGLGLGRAWHSGRQ